MVEVSVCIPVYGVEKYIEKCARSLFEQTMKEGIEFIFVNDCTPDKSIEILEQVLSEYPQRKAQVKIIHHEKNGGPVAARNTAIVHAAGKYMICCDADDWIAPDLYETMYAKAVGTDADVVCCSMIIPPDWKCKRIQKIVPDAADTPAEYIKKNVAGHLNHLVTKLYRREIVSGCLANVPGHLRMCEDLLCNVLMLEKCRTIAFVSDVCYHYIQNPDSGSHNWQYRHFENLKEIISILESKQNPMFLPVLLYLKTYILLNVLLSLSKLPGLEELFCEICRRLSLPDKLKIILSGKYTFRGRCALAVGFISQPLIFRLMKLIRV